MTTTEIRFVTYKRHLCINGAFFANPDVETRKFVGF